VANFRLEAEEMDKKLVVLSGAGISAESGLKTFRDSGGLWEGYRPEEVATPEAFAIDPELVLRFYNLRRADARNAEPNEAHLGLVKLEDHYSVDIITQNVDDLHERAGSTRVHHLHGSLFQSRSTRDPEIVYTLESSDIHLGDLCELGSQLRPNIVWFGEAVPMMDKAAGIVAQADILIIVGTSLVVYPAASLVQHTPAHCKHYIVDPLAHELVSQNETTTTISEPATIGIPLLVEKLSSTCD
jgi:NAD-dependent deacetylase